MRLTELDPHWTIEGDVPRRGMGITFLCPHCREQRLHVPFENPIDGGPAHASARRLWKREGETFDTLTLTPSVDASRVDRETAPGHWETTTTDHWHGFIRNGEIT